MSRAISFNRVTRRPVLASLLVEAPDQFLEDRAHRVVVETGEFHLPLAIKEWGAGSFKPNRHLDTRNDGQ